MQRSSTIDRAESLDLTDLEPAAAARVRMTVSCRDSDPIPKVDGAGTVRDLDGRSVQVMHNGILIDEGCYYGPWMTRIIQGLDGHHEPQEELVFHHVVQRLAETNPAGPRLVEFGSFWSYYSMWFCRVFPDGTALAMEPDPRYLEIGRRNAELNGLSARIRFVHGAVGDRPGEALQFTAESTGELVPVLQYDLQSLLDFAEIDRVDLAMIDIQGFETVLLERARPALASGRVGCLIVSTHHQSISGDMLTHQRVLDLLREYGAHIIAEHTVRESFSGDGLIAASFDPLFATLTVPLSHARSKESLFGEPEYELNQIDVTLAAERAELAHARAGQAAAEQAAAAASASLSKTTDELDRMRNTKLWRWSSKPRSWYTKLRSSR